jgi:OOP family OmpA-OmpF porin
MTARPIRIILIVAAMLAAASAQAQDNDWYVSGSVIFLNDDPYRAIDEGFAGAQFNGGRNMTEHLSLEGILGYSSLSSQGCNNPSDCYPDQDHLDFGVNLLAYYNRDSVITPYVLVGVGYLSVDVDEDPIYTRDSGESAASASLGLGLKWRMGQSNYSIRAEHRARTAFDDNNLTDQLTTIGLQYDFGGRRRDSGIPESNKDTDGDGVLDMWDACDSTPPGVDVTSRGCELKNIDRDSDGDHVNDNLDECPNSAVGAPVDRRGCSLDSDMDGVTTDKDRCPATRAGAEVNIYGCENDDDRDGVPNHRDSCPDSRTGVRIDVRGCEIKDIISLPGVNFETGFDILLPGNEYILEEAAATLNQYPELHIEVAGHSDDVGDAAANAGLSERRARTVRNLLIQYGVAEERLTFKGYGESQPIADNSTAEGRATNRRVELRLVNQ